MSNSSQKPLSVFAKLPDELIRHILTEHHGNFYVRKGKYIYIQKLSPEDERYQTIKNRFELRNYIYQTGIGFILFTGLNTAGRLRTVRLQQIIKSLESSNELYGVNLMRR